MIYFKSVLVGLLALLVSAAALAFIETIVPRFFDRLGPIIGVSLVFTTSISIMSPFLWSVVLLIFGAGFYWKYRRLSS